MLKSTIGNNVPFKHAFETLTFFYMSKVQQIEDQGDNDTKLPCQGTNQNDGILTIKVEND